VWINGQDEMKMINISTPPQDNEEREVIEFAPLRRVKQEW